MRQLGIAIVALVVAGVCSVTRAQNFSANFDTYKAGSLLHDVGGWKGWDGAPAAGGWVSNKFAFSGKNSLEVAAGTDLVHPFAVTGGRWVFSAMQYIPSGTTGETYFILLNQYRDGGMDDYDDWSVQTIFNLDTGTVAPWNSKPAGTIVYDRWVEVKYIIDLIANTVDEYYDGQQIAGRVWDDIGHRTIEAVDLYGNYASSVYYDNIKLERYYVYKALDPEPADLAIGVDPLLLSWAAGDDAVFHNVYFGTSPDLTIADHVVCQPAGETYYCPWETTPGATYYWRVDEITANGTVTAGDVWSFTVAPNTAHDPYPRDGDKWIDPNVMLTWTQNRLGASHELYFGANPSAVADRDPNVLMGALNVMSFDPGPLEKNTTYYWAVDEVYVVKCPGPMWSFTTGDGSGGVKAEYFRGVSFQGEPFVTRIEPSIDHIWGEDGVAGTVRDWFSARWTADLQIIIRDTYTFITTTDDGVRLWLDERLIIDNWTDHGATDDFSEPVTLEPGIYSLQMEWYDGAGGALAMLSWQTPKMPRQIIPPGPLQPCVYARALYPARADVSVSRNAILEWTAGDVAATHDLYLGTDKAVVEAATVADANVYQGSRPRTITRFDPGLLEANTSYYWRVDEVNDAPGGSLWKGMVWEFQTAASIFVDSFETYTDDPPDRLFQTWIDGRGFPPDEFFPAGHPGNGTGSAAGHDVWTAGTVYTTIAETRVVHTGRQSMPMSYNNQKAPFYSEIVRTWSVPQDWTTAGNSLYLWVRGQSDNAPARLYVAVQDSAGKIAVVSSTDETLVTRLDWNQWSIGLGGFDGVNVAAVKKVFIGAGSRDMPVRGGAGTIFIDDIAVATVRKR